MLPYFQAGVLFCVLASFVAGQYGAPAADPYGGAPIPYGQPAQVVTVPVPGPIDYNAPAYTNVRGGRHHGPFLDAFANNHRHHHDRSGRRHRKHHKGHKRQGRRSSRSSSSRSDDRS